MTEVTYPQFTSTTNQPPRYLIYVTYLQIVSTVGLIASTFLVPTLPFPLDAIVPAIFLMSQVVLLNAVTKAKDYASALGYIIIFLMILLALPYLLPSSSTAIYKGGNLINTIFLSVAQIIVPLLLGLSLFMSRKHFLKTVEQETTDSKSDLMKKRGLAFLSAVGLQVGLYSILWLLVYIVSSDNFANIEFYLFYSFTSVVTLILGNVMLMVKLRGKTSEKIVSAFVFTLTVTIMFSFIIPMVVSYFE